MKKIVNIFLSLLLLLATTGVTLNKHYCMGRLQSVAVFDSANPCMEVGFDEPMPCCEDISEELKVDEVTSVTFDFEIAPDLYQLAIISFVLIDPTFSSLEDDKPNFQNYLHPLPDQDINILNQSFLI